MIWVLLIIIGIIWLVFASVQDLRTKEVANWLSFSLIFIGLSARLIYSIAENNLSLFYYGIISSLVITIIAFALYFGRVFAGGDLKLMIGLGTFIPGHTFSSIIINCLAATISLLLAGAIYSFFASIFVVIKRRKDFKNSFGKERRLYFYIVPILILFWIFLNNTDFVGLWLLGFASFSLLSYPYFKAVDKCMIKLYNPNQLTEGDWLLENVKIGKNKTIEASVHGLSSKEIRLLVKARKKVMIKEGIPFVPAFLFAFIIMVFFFVLKGQDYFALLLQSLF